MSKHLKSREAGPGLPSDDLEYLHADSDSARGLKHRQSGSRLGQLFTAAAAVLVALAGIASVAIALNAQEQAPSPSAAAAIGVASTSEQTQSAQPTQSTPSGAQPAPDTSAAPVPSPVAVPLSLPAATPTHLDVPAIGISTDLLQLGTNADGTAQVPPLGKDSLAGWYDGSPTPGQLGPSVIFGHVDSKAYGPGVFFKLGALTPGEQISVTRADGTVAVFNIDKVVQYPKDQFPTIDVYGNTTNAALRLVTCGGQFDYSTRSYEDNIVAYATLTSTKN